MAVFTAFVGFAQGIRGRRREEFNNCQETAGVADDQLTYTWAQQQRAGPACALPQGCGGGGTSSFVLRL
jgi:hypothetical protein